MRTYTDRFAVHDSLYWTSRVAKRCTFSGCNSSPKHGEGHRSPRPRIDNAAVYTRHTTVHSGTCGDTFGAGSACCLLYVRNPDARVVYLLRRVSTHEYRSGKPKTRIDRLAGTNTSAIYRYRLTGNVTSFQLPLIKPGGQARSNHLLHTLLSYSRPPPPHNL